MGKKEASRRDNRLPTGEQVEFLVRGMLGGIPAPLERRDCLGWESRSHLTAIPVPVSAAGNRRSFGEGEVGWV